jgi:hypothetical protein
VNKRSATLISAALVGVLAIGGAAFSLGLTGPTASAATGRRTTANSKPIVRTHTKTIVVHRQAPPAAPRVVQVSSANLASPSSSGSSYEGDDSYEDQGSDDDGVEDHGGQSDDGQSQGGEQDD